MKKSLNLNESIIFIGFVFISIVYHQLLSDYILASLIMFIITILYGLRILKQKPEINRLLDKNEFSSEYDNKSLFISLLAIFAIIFELFELITLLLFNLFSGYDLLLFIFSMVFIISLFILAIIEIYIFIKIARNARRSKIR